MKIMVIGAGGLLGGRIVEHEVQMGHNVFAAVRNAEQVEYLRSLNANVVHLNLENLDGVENKLNNVDLIVYAAGLNAKESELDPQKAISLRGTGTKRLLEAAIKCRVKYFIYISSAHVYSNTLIGSFNENSPLLNQSPYAISHQAGERVVLQSAKDGSIEGLVVRISNGFGCPLNRDVNCWGLLVNDLCRQVLLTGSMTIKGDGTDMRSFIPISEICHAIEFLIKNMPFGTDSRRVRVLNLGGGQSLSTYEMAKLIKKRFKYLMEINPKINISCSGQLNKSIYHKSYIYESKLINDLGYVSRNRVVEEVDRLINFCRDNFGIDNNIEK